MDVFAYYIKTVAYKNTALMFVFAAPWRFILKKNLFFTQKNCFFGSKKGFFSNYSAMGQK